MDTIPTETLALILSFACTDDGSTARSVALVSHYFHEVAKPYAYQSVSVAGLAQMQMLLDRLEQLPQPMRRVRNIFMSDFTHQQAQQLEAGMPLASAESALNQYDAEKATMQQLLALVSPTVETLTFLAYNPFNSTPLLARVFATPFHALLELTVRGFYPFPHSPLAMPRLERLHLRGNRNPHGLLQLGGLDATCPSLTHLRVSGLSSAVSFAREVESAYGVEDYDSSSSAQSAAADVFPARLPGKLQYLLIQPGPAAVQRSRRGKVLSNRNDEHMMACLADLTRKTPARDDEPSLVYALLERRDESEDTFEINMREWAGRLAGGPGCWKM